MLKTGPDLDKHIWKETLMMWNLNSYQTNISLENKTGGDVEDKLILKNIYLE